MAGAGRTGVRRSRAVVACATLLVLTACSPAGEAPEPTDPPASSSPSEPPGSTSPAPDTPAASPASQPLTIALAGDVHFEGVLRDRLRDPATALAPVSAALSAADVTIVNLETSLGTGGAPDPTKRFTFSAGPAALTALAAAGVDVATMANNHALDYGRERLPSTFRAIDSARRADPPLDVIGIGRDADEAFRPAISEVDGTTVATLTASLADQDPTADPTGAWAATDDTTGIADAIDPARLLASVREADRQADVVVAYLHWGVQGDRCPSDEQRTLARRLVDAGADVVAGTHAHQLQGDGRVGNAYVAYGLGNFAWYSSGDSTSSRTGVLHLTIRPRTHGPRPPHVVRAAWTPLRIGADGLPATATPADAADFRSDRESLRSCAGLD